LRVAEGRGGQPFVTTIEAPPVAAPEMILIALPFDFCQALMAGFGPT
jgi:hypothetical protein